MSCNKKKEQKEQKEQKVEALEGVCQRSTITTDETWESAEPARMWKKSRLEKRLIPGKERRVIVEPDTINQAIYSYIGQLDIEIHIPNHDSKVRTKKGEKLTIIKKYLATGSLSRIMKARDTVSGEPGGWSKMYLVTAAHNFCIWDEVDGRTRPLNAGTFYWRRQGTNYLSKMTITRYAIYPRFHPKYAENFNGYDYAIATVEADRTVQENFVGGFCSNSSFLKHLKTGDALRVSGYSSSTKKANMLTMAGSVRSVTYPTPGYGIVTYSDIDTCEGQSGSPVFVVPPFSDDFLEATNNNMNGIRVGVHIGAGRSYNVANLETKAITTWRDWVLKEWGII